MGKGKKNYEKETLNYGKSHVSNEKKTIDIWGREYEKNRERNQFW